MGSFEINFGLFEFGFDMGSTLHRSFFGFPYFFEVGIFFTQSGYIVFNLFQPFAGGLILVFFKCFALNL